MRAFSQSSLNGHNTQGSSIAKHEEYASFDPREKQDLDENDIGIKRDDLDAVGLLFQCIKELFNEHNPDKDETLLEQFDDHVKHVMQDLGSKLAENDESRNRMVQVLKVAPSCRS